MPTCPARDARSRVLYIMIGKWQSRTDAKRIVRGEVGIGDTPHNRSQKALNLDQCFSFIGKAERCDSF